MAVENLERSPVASELVTVARVCEETATARELLDDGGAAPLPSRRCRRGLGPRAEREAARPSRPATASPGSRPRPSTATATAVGPRPGSRCRRRGPTPGSSRSCASRCRACWVTSCSPWCTGHESPHPTYDVAQALVLRTLEARDERERLHDLQARVDNAQQLAGMGDYDWHVASDTNEWSDQLYRIYGHEPQSFNASYERFLSFIHPDDREMVSQVHRRAYETGEPYQMVERILRDDGELRYLATNGQVLQDADGTPVRFRGTCIDITERTRAEEERERSRVLFQELAEAAPDAIVVCGPDRVVVQANGRAVGLLGGDPVGRRAAGDPAGLGG